MQALLRIPARSRVPAVRRCGLLCATLVAAFLVAACRGRDSAAATANAGGTVAGSSTPSVSAAPATSGRTIDVQMIGDATGYRFVPATVTIKAGETVRWTNVSGGPHNVTFWADSIPAGAGGQLQARMPGTMSPLSGPLLTTPNATYTVSFAGAAAGAYTYYCTPHLALGMKAKIVVEQ